MYKYLELSKEKDLILKINVSNVGEEYIDNGINEIINSIEKVKNN